ncbi:MAG: MFS transporter [Methanosarcinaceae archaeon]|nr:MFS transporter [Methanosarcinaceae archaeon]
MQTQPPEKEPDFLIPGIKKNVFVLGLVSLFTDISSEMLYPVIPIFLTAVLGAPMYVVGLIEGIAEGTASILKVISGWYSDRTGKRKPFVIVGYSLSAISKPLMAFAYIWPLVLGARFLDRFGKGVRTSARDALIADSTPVAQRGRSFGLHRTMDTFGAVLGPMIAILILYITADNYRLLFMLAFLPALVSIVLIVFFVSERRQVPNAKVSFKISQFGRDFKVFLLISVIFALGNSSDVFLILRATDVGITITAVLLCYIVYNIANAIGSYPAGVLSDRIGRRSLMLWGFLIFAAVYIGFALMPANIYVWPLFAIYGIYAAFTNGVAKAYVVDLVPFDKRGTALGIYHTATGVMIIFSSIIAGLLWEFIGSSAPFVYGAATAVLSAVFLLILMPKRHEMVG